MSEEFIIFFTILIVVALIFVGYVIYRRIQKIKEGKLIDGLDFSELNYGRITKRVTYDSYRRYRNLGEAVTKTVTAKVKFKESLGKDKIKIEYVDMKYCLAVLDTYHNMVTYGDIEWIEYNGNDDIVLSKSEFLGMIGGVRYRKKGEIITLDKDVTAADLLDYIATKSI